MRREQSAERHSASALRRLPLAADRGRRQGQAAALPAHRQRRLPAWRMDRKAGRTGGQHLCRRVSVIAEQGQCQLAVDGGPLGGGDRGGPAGTRRGTWAGRECCCSCCAGTRRGAGRLASAIAPEVSRRRSVVYIRDVARDGLDIALPRG